MWHLFSNEKNHTYKAKQQIKKVYSKLIDVAFTPMQYTYESITGGGKDGMSRLGRDLAYLMLPSLIIISFIAFIGGVTSLVAVTIGAPFLIATAKIQDFFSKQQKDKTTNLNINNQCQDRKKTESSLGLRKGAKYIYSTLGTAKNNCVDTMQDKQLNNSILEINEKDGSSLPIIENTKLKDAIGLQNQELEREIPVLKC